MVDLGRGVRERRRRAPVVAAGRVPGEGLGFSGTGSKGRPSKEPFQFDG